MAPWPSKRIWFVVRWNAFSARAKLPFPAGNFPACNKQLAAGATRRRGCTGGRFYCWGTPPQNCGRLHVPRARVLLHELLGKPSEPLRGRAGKENWPTYLGRPHAVLRIVADEVGYGGSASCAQTVCFASPMRSTSCRIRVASRARGGEGRPRECKPRNRPPANPGAACKG